MSNRLVLWLPPSPKTQGKTEFSFKKGEVELMVEKEIEKPMVVWRLGYCKRCGGSMYNEYREGFRCLQCGYEEEVRGFKPIKYTTGRRDKWE